MQAPLLDIADMPLRDLPLQREARSGDGCRWSLSRRWGEGPAVAWLMLNPSTADAEREDPTLWRCIAFAHRWGYRAIEVVNVFPKITPDPRELWAWVGENPDRAADAVLRSKADMQTRCTGAARHVAAFGSVVGVREPGALCLALNQFSQPLGGGKAAPLWCLGTNRYGWPLHPLARGKNRVPDDRQLVRWRRP